MNIAESLVEIITTPVERILETIGTATNPVAKIIATNLAEKNTEVLETTKSIATNPIESLIEDNRGQTQFQMKCVVVVALTIETSIMVVRITTK
jgi:hypothetical protein